jgi:membrane protein implicated in regulation of membrane protease activity
VRTATIVGLLLLLPAMFVSFASLFTGVAFGLESYEAADTPARIIGVVWILFPFALVYAVIAMRRAHTRGRPSAARRARLIGIVWTVTSILGYVYFTAIYA